MSKSTIGMPQHQDVSLRLLVLTSLQIPDTYYRWRHKVQRQRGLYQRQRDYEHVCGGIVDRHNCYRSRFNDVMHTYRHATKAAERTSSILPQLKPYQDDHHRLKRVTRICARASQLSNLYATGDGPLPRNDQ